MSQREDTTQLIKPWPVLLDHYILPIYAPGRACSTWPFARNVVGWSMKPTLSRELALDALLMAVWRRKPAESVIMHSDSNNAGVSFVITQFAV